MALDVDESARKFLERAQRARTDRERRAAALRERVLQEVAALLPQGGRAWLIGSLAWGGFGERSDVDLVVAGVSGADATRMEAAVASETGTQVDLLPFDELPRSFRDRIEREGIAIHGR